MSKMQYKLKKTFLGWDIAQIANTRQNRVEIELSLSEKFHLTLQADRQYVDYQLVKMLPDWMEPFDNMQARVKYMKSQLGSAPLSLT